MNIRSLLAATAFGLILSVVSADQAQAVSYDHSMLVSYRTITTRSGRIIERRSLRELPDKESSATTRNFTTIGTRATTFRQKEETAPTKEEVTAGMNEKECMEHNAMVAMIASEVKKVVYGQPGGRGRVSEALEAYFKEKMHDCNKSKMMDNQDVMMEDTSMDEEITEVKEEWSPAIMRRCGRLKAGSFTRCVNSMKKY